MRLFLLPQIFPQLGQIGVELNETARADPEDMGVGDGPDGGAMGQVAAQQRNVSEVIARPQPVRSPRSIRRAPGYHLDGAGLDYVNVAAGIAFVENHLTGAEFLQHHRAL